MRSAEPRPAPPSRPRGLGRGDPTGRRRGRRATRRPRIGPRRVPLYLVVVAVWVMWVAAAPTPTAGEAVGFSLHLDPPLADVRPDLDLVELRIEVPPTPGALLPRQPLAFEIALGAPPSPSWLSTDFPAVEGSELFRGGGLLRDDAFTLNTMFPIRGDYRLHFRVFPPGAPQLARERTWVLSVGEAPEKKRNFALLLIALTGFGAGSGLVLGRSARAEARARG